MTFPRRLTPSAVERSTIVQQRMAPGGALGVGSRHVRPGDQRQATGSAGGSGGVLAIGRYSCSTTFAAGGILVMVNLDSSYGPIEDHVSINGDGTLGMLTVGMYQVSGGGSVSAVGGTLCGLAVNPFIAPPKPFIANRSDADSGGQANLQCSAPPFFNDTAGNEIQASVSPSGSVSSPVITLYVVKFVD